VLALLDAGINVSAMTCSTESLNGLIERATGVGGARDRAGSFLKQADQVVNLDLAVEASRKVASGQIYAPGDPWALETSSRTDLARMRERRCAEVAESLDRAGVARAPRAEGSGG